jgi:hypothetical protein
MAQLLNIVEINEKSLQEAPEMVAGRRPSSQRVRFQRNKRLSSVRFWEMGMQQTSPSAS